MKQPFFPLFLSLVLNNPSNINKALRYWKTNVDSGSNTYQRAKPFFQNINSFSSLSFFYLGYSIEFPNIFT